MRFVLLAVLPALALSACATAPSPETLELTEPEARGYAFARDHCAACHAITASGRSRNPEAPGFEMVVNARGLTARTLEAFLRDSHNFPGQMAFAIDPAKVDDLTAYMLTLRKPGYKPPI